MTWPADIARLTAADVMHRRLSTLAADASVGELRAYFDASSSRRLALIADGRRYVGAVRADALPDDASSSAPAAQYAERDVVIAPGAPATLARDLGLREPSRRVPVVGETGTLLGIVAVNRSRDGFCGRDEPAAA